VRVANGREKNHLRKTFLGGDGTKLLHDKKIGEGNRKNGNKYLSWAYVVAAQKARQSYPVIKLAVRYRYDWRFIPLAVLCHGLTLRPIPVSAYYGYARIGTSEIEDPHDEFTGIESHGRRVFRLERCY
jgi:hypothetical protein